MDVWFYVCMGVTTLFLVVASWQDVKTKTVPLWIPFVTAVPGVVLILVEKEDFVWINFLILAGILLLFSLITNQRLGFGDSLILTALIPACGVSGVIMVISGAASFCIIHLAGTLVVCPFRKREQRELPYIPFIAAGFILRTILMIWRC